MELWDPTCKGPRKEPNSALVRSLVLPFNPPSRSAWVMELVMLSCCHWGDS